MKVKILWLVVIAGIAFILSLAINRVWVDMRRVATTSSIRALLAGLEKHGKEIPLFQEATPWRKLSESEYDRVISFLDQKKVGFDQKDWRPGKPLVDYWGTRYDIFYRKTDKGLEFMSRSAGRDRAFETDDDILPPFQKEWRAIMEKIR